MKPELVEQIKRSGLEFMSCYRARDGICYLIAGHTASSDYGHNSGYNLEAWKEGTDDPLVHIAKLQFMASGSALATAKVKRFLTAQPDLLKRLAVAHIKRMLDEGRSSEEILLRSDAPDSEYIVSDPSGDPVVAQKCLREEILVELARRHSQGELTVWHRLIRDQSCAADEWVERALRLMVKQRLLTADGLKNGKLELTDEGHLVAESLVAAIPSRPLASVPQAATPPQLFDCFVSYAGEDRTTVKALVQALTARDVQVWWDKGQITLGDQLSKKIEEGLRLSRYGLVMVSDAFVAKKWTDAELRALHARAMSSGQKVLLPVLVGMSHSKFAAQYPLLADLVTTEYRGDVAGIAEEIIRAMQ